ncbi:leucine--tRNA ligase [Patescibacteria group bacterium]
MKEYNHKKIEERWQKEWEKDTVAKIDKDDTSKEKYYLLDMFPYPSGDGLHMGHTESYAASDIYYRYKKMNGFNVLHPQGFDSFGLPAENYAIKTKVHPKETTVKNIENYIKQMRSLGFNYDFDEKVVTSNPEYYEWTQWIFAQLFENNLAYKKTSLTNWCESCKTILANEQVEDGACERCKSEVVMKEVPGWFFKITDFADDLIDGLGKVDWPEHTKVNQKNWIGKSEGAKLKFKVSNTDKEMEVFTTRPDTLFGCTYCVLAPEHELVQGLKETIENWGEVEKYLEGVQKKTELERMEGKEKTGVELKGVKAINPANQEEIPIFIADYVLAGYGTGAIMAVPAHDERDFEFAKKFDLPITEVISGGDISKEAYVGDGELINSGKFDGKSVVEAKKEITEFVGGELTNTYRLRDWSISRQRYWGAPIPIVYSPEGEAKFVGEENLPWLLPEDVDFVPTGTAPLAKSKELFDRTEKIFGEGWTPEVDTLDTFVCSSWYYLRYPDPHNEKEFCGKERLKHWLPVDTYIGGAEHTYMHLLYARFITKALNKIGVLNFDEPFLKLRHQGMVLDEKGKKMSKSKGNVVNPETMVEKFGADAVRMYMMFAGPLEEDVMWKEDNIVGTYRFLERVWKLKDKTSEHADEANAETVLNQTIKKVGEDLEQMKFNTAIAQMMIFVNQAERQEINQTQYKNFLKLLAPFAPHITEELWAELGNSTSIHLEEWPEYDESKTMDKTVTIAVQVNGKIRGTFEIEADSNEEMVKKEAQELESVKKWTEEKDVKKVICVPNKLVSIVTN